MKKEQVSGKICDVGVVAVIRGKNPEEAIKIADACIAGGVTAVEIAFTTPRAHEAIATLAQKYTEDEIVLGAGTVLDPETARLAILSGAQFVVAPAVNADTIRMCNRYRVLCLPGAVTIEGVIKGMECGADIIKIFPGELSGPKLIKAITGPLPYAQLMPTGGVNVDNVKDWIKAGCVAVGAGSSLTAGAKTGNFKLVTETAKKFVAAVRLARTEN